MRCLLLLILVLTYDSSGQIQNSSGNTLFFTDRAKQVKLESFGKDKSKKFEVSASGRIRKLLFDKWADIQYFYYAENGIDSIYTVSTSPGLIGKLSFESDEGFFTNEGRTKFGIELGVIKGINELNQYKLRKWRGAYSFGATIKYAYENQVNLYDTITLTRSREYPGIFSINTHLEVYPKFLKGLAIGLTGGYRYESNISTLTGYQDLPVTFQNSDIIALGDEKGKIGEFEYINNYYISISSPFFPFRADKGNSNLTRIVLSRFCLVPFIHDTFGGMNILNPGATLSIVDIPLNTDKYQKIFTSSFNIGVDWIRMDGNWSGPIIFFGGTLSVLETFKPEKTKDLDKKIKGIGL